MSPDHLAVWINKVVLAEEFLAGKGIAYDGIGDSKEVRKMIDAILLLILPWEFYLKEHRCLQKPIYLQQNYGYTI